MALVVKDRVKETTVTTGTGTLTLGGAVTGFQTFSAVLSNADTTYYAIFESSTGAFEVGLGTFTLSGTTLARTTVLESSNAGAAINLTAGAADVFITQPAEKAVYLDAAGSVTSSAGQIDISDFNNDAGYSTTTGTVTSVAASAGTGISISGSPITTTGTLTITNTAPHIATNLTYSTASTTGTVNSSTGTNATLPAATTSLAGLLTGADKTKLNGVATGATANTGTVTSVGGTGTVNGISLSGTVTSSGNLTLGGSVSINNANWSGTDLAVANGGTGASSFTANNVLLGNGTSAFQTVAPGTSGNILASNGTTWQSVAPAGASGTLQAVASGALSDGSTVVINADGTVSVVSGVTQELGTPTLFQNSSTSSPSATFDTSNNKVVIAYRDQGNTNFGTAIVGTVSDTAISFGTAVVFRSADTRSSSATFDSSNNKVVIAYRDEANSGFGTAIVGTVSGTSISFGTPVVFSLNSFTEAISATFDSSNNKVVIAYKDTGNSNFGTAIVGTVSGTSISFGTPVVFESASTGPISATFGGSNNRVVIAYRDQGNTNFGTAIVGTVSGTSISFGTAVVFESGTTLSVSPTFDGSNNRVVIAYRVSQKANFGTAIVGTVSGTSISFGTPVVFESAPTEAISATFDSSVGRVVIAYKDEGNSSFGTVIVGNVSGTSISFFDAQVFESAFTEGASTTFDNSNNRVIIAYRDEGNTGKGTATVLKTGATNLTPDNFIGFSNAAYANAATATIQLVGSVDDAQSGLTAARKHFVQIDGTLSTAPDFPEVFAGVAVSATKIIVKG